MQKEEMNEQIERLKIEWPSSYKASKIELIIEDFTGFEYDHFKTMVGRALRSFRQAPQVNDLWKINNDLIQEGWVFKSKEKVTVNNITGEASESLPLEENRRRAGIFRNWFRLASNNPLKTIEALESAIWPDETKDQRDRNYFHAFGMNK